ncbi:MAG: sugar phosphate isomerase/epimerase [Treponema sp.]|jgi:sugar phosphate isomerase/epimerase|nr:sugar phosphate isomerase/epimerase [Treponema sp.]
MEKRYIQLYSLRDNLYKDFIGVLERMAEIGYTGVEFAGGFYGSLSATELKKKLDDLKLEGISSHISLEQVAANLDFVSELGVKYIIVPFGILSDYEEALALAKKLNDTGKICREQGIAFGYHNHRHEFLEGKDGYLLETLLLNTDPQWVCFQLDVGWAACAGVDIPGFIKKYPGRFKLIHVKECSTVAGPEKMPDFSKFPRDSNGRPQFPPELIAKFIEQTKWNVPSGKGIIDWPAVRDAALAQGTEGFIIEREFNYADDIFKCVEEDCMFLKSL